MWDLTTVSSGRARKDAGLAVADEWVKDERRAGSLVEPPRLCSGGSPKLIWNRAKLYKPYSSMHAHPLKRIVITSCIIASCLAIVLLVAMKVKRPARDLENILHGDRSVAISKMEIRIGTSAQISLITNQLELTHLSANFRNATIDPPDLGKMYNSSIYFNDGRRIDTFVIMNDNLKYMVVAVPTFMDLSDPVLYRVSLDSLMPTDLSNTLRSIVPK